MTAACNPKRCSMCCASASGSSASSRITSPPISLFNSGGSAQRDHVAFGVNRQAIAALGLFHQVGGDQHGDVFFVAQNLQVLPEVATRARIEAGGRLVEQQNRRMMQQSLGQFETALHAAGKVLGFFFRAIGESDAGEHLGHARLQCAAAQSVDVANQHQVFFGGELDVDALFLEDHADLVADSAGVLGDIASHDERASAGRNHQRRENAKRRGLAAAVGAQQAKNFRRTNFERHARQRGAVTVLMAQVLQLNDG